ncbi:hypothetical protein [Paracoccus sp. (in: a-proteobacteria)]|uniref:hypothetical protein n=1 Tax=Paracoccus sp. TaxID=267 RepID=UPI00289B06EB|nr:hypothetical protein [Paracoccus sp. (in: a-proteobacteria)]
MTALPANPLLTPALFDAMFECPEFQDHLKKAWLGFTAEAEAKKVAEKIACARSHGTEGILREEFGGRIDVNGEEVSARRAELHAEFDRRFGG